MNYSLCICTYKRTNLLELLLTDISAQSVQPNCVIIVDGDPISASVITMLSESQLQFRKIAYIPSNHGNLPYQRYLGWRIAQQSGTKFLLYLDDDLRIHNPDAIRSLLVPLLSDEKVVGVSADTSSAVLGVLSTQGIFTDQHDRQGTNTLVRLFGSGKGTEPGGLAPSGHRRFPIRKDNGFVKVEWLQGRVMLYRMKAIDQKTFSENLFSMYEIRIGKGEDTYLSRQIGNGGKLMLGFGLGFEHPNADLPNCYPIEANKFGYASAYSRRFLNDHYRVMKPAQLGDRWALLKSYIGNSFLNWGRAFLHPQKYRFAYARGYSVGALRGVFQKPTAKNLTPEIRWWQDAEEALDHLKLLKTSNKVSG